MLRRLNRTEYRNTLRDLLHVDVSLFDPTEEFPVDEERHGFDNIGEALVTSDSLLQQYLKAAGRALDQATADGKRPKQEKRLFSNPIHRSTKGSGISRASRDSKPGYDEIFSRPTKRGGHLAPMDMKRGVPISGLYRLRIKAAGVDPKGAYWPEITGFDRDLPMRLGVLATNTAKAGLLSRFVPGDVEVTEFEIPKDGRPQNYEITVQFESVRWR